MSSRRASSTTRFYSTRNSGTPRIVGNRTCGVTRFVVDCETLLRIAAGNVEVEAEHTLVAPTLVHSQALAAL